MTDSYTIHYSPEAIDDLRDIYSYIADELLSPDNAKSQVKRIRQSIRSLDFMPARHTLVDWEPWCSMNMRFFPIDNFIVYYLVDSDNLSVFIVRIFYSGRDVKNIILSQNQD